MEIPNVTLADGEAAADYVFDKIEEGADAVAIWYKDLKVNEVKQFPGKIDGAKGNPPDSTFEQILSKGSNPDINFAEIKKTKMGLYGGDANKAKSAQYELDDKGTLSDPEDAVLSKINNWSLLKYRGDGDNPDLTKAQLGRSSISGAEGKMYANPTANVLIDTCNNMASPSFHYSHKDFIFTKWYGKIPNNYMLTLRRFMFPVEDNIIDPVVYSYEDKSPKQNIQPTIAQAVTWMGGTAGNELKEILKFGVGYKWKSVEAGIQEINNKPRDRGFVGGFLDGLPKSQGVQGGLRGESAYQTRRRRAHGDGWDPIKQTYPNHTFAPLNIIKEMQVRDSGLTFDQSFSLTFEFNLKGIPNTSPKAALLDIMANMLALTYSNAPFWGGSIRHVGNAKQMGKPFGDLSKLQSGDYKGFLGSVMKDLTKGISNIADDLSKMGDSKILNNVVGGGLMDLFGGPQGGQVAQAFLTGESTGNWHLTVGNPLNPIAVIGNLGCTKANFEFDGPLGYEDFPSKLKVVVELQPNRPRDKSDIESMFNAGKGRLYIPQDAILNPNAEYNPSAYGDKDFGGKSKSEAMKKAAKFANG